MKILVIRLSSLADVLLATPLLRCLQQQLAPATVHLLTARENEGAVASNPFVHHIHYWHHEVDNSKSLIAEGYSHIIDLQNDAQSKSICQPLSLKPLQLKKQPVAEGLNSLFGTQVIKLPHLTQRYFTTAASLAVHNDGQGLTFLIPKEFETAASDIPASHQLGFVVVHLSAGIRQDVVKEFCKQLAHPVLLSGDLHQQATGNSIASVDSVKVYNACGKFSFYETADLWQRSKMVITADVATAQIAAALQKPVAFIGAKKNIATGRGPYHGNRWGEKKMWLSLPQKETLLLQQVQAFLQTGKLG